MRVAAVVTPRTLLLLLLLATGRVPRLEPASCRNLECRGVGRRVQVFPDCSKRQSCEWGAHQRALALLEGGIDGVSLV